MSIDRSKTKDFDSLKNSSRSNGRGSEDIPTLRPSRAGIDEATTKNVESPEARTWNETESKAAAFPESAPQSVPIDAPNLPVPSKKYKKKAKDTKLIEKDRWLVRNGHTVTYICLYLFSVIVLFRPYELVPGLQFLSGTAVIFAVATIAIYIPSQIVSEGNLTTFPTEVKAVLAMALIALVTLPVAKDPGLAWETFNEPFIKAVTMFIVMVNVLRTRKRLMGLMWLSLGIGVYLSLAALKLYMEGKFTIESYRVGVEVGGMFGNPNDMAIHFVMMTPLAVALGMASKNIVGKCLYFGMAVLFVAANMVTFSRGGFIGLIVCSAVLAWKLGRRRRLTVSLVSIGVGAIALIAAPGNYGLRILSIFIPGLDPVGSSDQRQDLLIRSLMVTARNPWGIGIGNFPVVGIRNLQTHNAYTQVSTELGILGLIAYVVFIVSPLRKLGAIERVLFDKNDDSWFYYLSIGLQASIVGFMVSSFFVSIAYNWFIYYMIAYAVAFRRVYSLENGLAEEVKTTPFWSRQTVPST